MYLHNLTLSLEADLKHANSKICIFNAFTFNIHIFELDASYDSTKLVYTLFKFYQSNKFRGGHLWRF